MGAEKRKVNLPDDYIARIVDSVTAAVPETESIYIFGSYARGEETPESDVDIYVTTASASEDAYDLEAMTNLRLALLWMDRPKDVVCASRHAFETRARHVPCLENSVLQDGVRING